MFKDKTVPTGIFKQPVNGLVHIGTNGVVFLGWSGLHGRGRALGVGKVKFSGQIYPDAGLIRYQLHIKRVIKKPLVVGIADGMVIHNGNCIYQANDLKVGLIK